MKIIIIIFIITSQFCVSQNNAQIRTIDSVMTSFQIDSLNSLYGSNKSIPKKYEISILLALSYYPELINSKIVFKESKITTTLNARPTILSLLFRKKTHRKYIVRINNQQRDSLVTLTEVPFNAKIGLLGHEMNHFIDYMNMNIFGITKRLLTYTNKKSKETFEKEIDLMTINRGLGWQLYDWSAYVLYKAKLEYKEFKKLIYLEPKEILEIIEEAKRS